MPHPLDGPRAKVNRAESQLAALQTTLKDFFRRNPYEVVVAEFDRRAGHYNLRVSSGPTAMPDEWGAVIGEIAHDLRSALDGLAWQLALLRVSEPFKYTSFPIYRIGNTTQRRGGNLIAHFRKNGTSDIQSIDRRLWTRVEAFQPYKLGNGGKLSPLFLLHELNRIDKHRLITVLVTTVAGMEVTGLSGAVRLKLRVRLEPNAKVGDVRPLPVGGVPILDLASGGIRTVYEVEVDTRIATGVRFGDGCDAVKGLPVIRTLEGMTNEVSRVVESFAGEFE